MWIILSVRSSGLALQRLTVKLSKSERDMSLIHHGPSAMEVAEHLGYLIVVELTSGVTVNGRLEAVDEKAVYLGRTERYPVLALHDIKRVDRR
jgi:hypothetical protein